MNIISLYKSDMKILSSSLGKNKQFKISRTRIKYQRINLHSHKLKSR